MIKDDLTLALRCIASEFFLDDEGPGQRIVEAAAELDRLSRIEDKYVNLCPVLNEQAGEIEHMRRLLQSKYDQEQNGVQMDNYAWTIGVETALGYRHEPPEHHVTDSIGGPEPAP